MRFHTAVNRFVWLACNKKPITVWRTALEQKRPYLCLDDGVRAVQFVIKQALFNGAVYNVVSENTTVQSVLSLLRPMVGELTVELIESPLMNELTYEVQTAKIKQAGFQFLGSLEQSIQESVSALRTLLG
jgi:nucleoside-diphosphate-sugar epimerase